MARFRAEGVIPAAVVLAIVSVGSSACGAHGRSAPVTLGLAGSRVMLSSTPREGCTMLGEVRGWSSSAGSMNAAVQWARNDIRNNSAAMGANFVLLETQAGGSSQSTTVLPTMYAVSTTTRHSFTIYGTAFRCPEAAE